MHSLATRLTNLFALWVVIGTAWAWLFPTHFTWFRPFIGPGLGVIMLGMGITLRFDHFRDVFANPRAVAIGVAAQFVIMPALGFGIAKVFALPPALAVGVILVSCCPGGTASNVIAFLARANLPLSVLMTMCSTFVAILATPWLTKLLAGAYMPIDAWALFQTTVTIVLVPVVAGILINHRFSKHIASIKPWSPLVSIIVIVLIVGCIVALRKEDLSNQAPKLLVAVFVLHASGFGLGYLVARLLKLPTDFRRTISIEVGMQNSGLGAALANAHFAAQPLAAVPSAISAVYHCLIGSFLAAFWGRRSED